MTETQMFYARFGSNIVALLMVFACWRWRTVGRWMFVLLFAWAAQMNLRTAITRPDVYLEYAPLAYSEAYRHFILGYFARHITAIVGTIAIGQLLIAILISLRGRAVRLGLTGAIVFLVAIIPLGIGSGFPATPIMALAAGLLLRSPCERTLWSGTWQWITTRHSHELSTIDPHTHA